MVRTYLKYEFSQTFGVVASGSSNIVWASSSTADPSVRDTGAGQAYVGANEEVLCWDVKKGELISRWRDKDCIAEVTAIARGKIDQDIFAVGHADGSVRIWDARIASIILTFNGHRSAITTLAFDDSGVRLASGSKDTDIIVWDLVAETSLFRLRGHKDQITGLHFIQPSTSIGVDESIDGVEGNAQGDLPAGFMLSTSKDALVKIWDIASQYCVETHVTQSNGECWALGVSPDHSGCITAGNDGELKVWALDLQGLRTHAASLDVPADQKFLIERGELHRMGKDRTLGIHFHPKADYIAVHGSEKAIELWRIRSPAEIQKTISRKRKRRREKLAATDQMDVDGEDATAQDDEDISKALVTDVFVSYVIVRTSGKVRSIDWPQTRSKKSVDLLAATTNNQLELYSVPISPPTTNKKSKIVDPSEYQRSLAVDLPGHRTDVRALSLSSDDKMLATASSGSLKVWNLRTANCIRTLECGYGLCCSFLPGDRIVLVGTKSGDLELFDIATSSMISTVKAHDGAIWTMRVHPDGKSVVTGSADKSAKFWRFDVVQEEIAGTKRTTPRLQLTHTRTLKLGDDILALCFTPDGRLLAASTLDNTVKVFFTDSLKLYLNLYGHKLPVLHIAIASDSKLLATCSADKNIRLWGLDFGDCHRALFAHEDSIMALAFIPSPSQKEDAHTLFSVSKDGALKTWDADRFTQLQRLRGHHGEIWALAVTSNGDAIVTAAHDRSIRVWSLADEPLFLEEEQDKELEDSYDARLAAQLDRDAADADALAGDTAEDDTAPASRQTAATLTAGERIAEALTLCHDDLLASRAHAAGNALPPQRHPVLALRNLAPESHLLAVLQAIPAPALHDALLLLPFASLPPLFEFIAIFLDRQMDVPLACRVLFFLLRTHHRQTVASGELRPLLERCRGALRGSLGRWKDILGWNLAATRVLGERLGQRSVVQARVEDAEDGLGQEKSVRKRGFVSVA